MHIMLGSDHGLSQLIQKLFLSIFPIKLRLMDPNSWVILECIILFDLNLTVNISWISVKFGLTPIHRAVR